MTDSAHTFSIGAKIALVVAILVAGYAGSISLGALQALRERTKLAALAAVDVPAALEAQAALFAFEEAHGAQQRHVDGRLNGVRCHD